MELSVFVSAPAETRLWYFLNTSQVLHRSSRM